MAHTNKSESFTLTLIRSNLKGFVEVSRVEISAKGKTQEQALDRFKQLLAATEGLFKAKH